MMSDAAYWITLAHLPRWRTARINSIIIKFFVEEKISIEHFFQLPVESLTGRYAFTQKELDDFSSAKNEIANNAFLAESMINQGFEIIPITSSEYSPILKENMKASNAPPLIYVKGNKQLLKEHTIAIVGSRTASEKAIQFTDTVAGSASRSFKVVVSGFAKGVDRQALDSAIAHTGQSIIVLPQGITTFASGFKKYYQQIAEGNVLVLSSFHPRAPWQVELAMARNPIIYGLAKDIYVAETSESGGTWSGAIDGLRRGRTVYVRNPEDGEKNANHLLIEKGGIPVDMHGERIAESENTVFMVKEEMPVETLEDKINKLLLGGALSPEDIDRRLSLSWGKEKLIRYLNSLDTIEKIKIGRKNHYRIKQSGGEANMTLFS